MDCLLAGAGLLFFFAGDFFVDSGWLRVAVSSKRYRSQPEMLIPSIPNAHNVRNQTAFRLSLFSLDSRTSLGELCHSLWKIHGDFVQQN